jgi:hypothetical protein
MVCGRAVSLGGGCCSGRGARQWPEVALDGKAASANEAYDRLRASTGPRGGLWLSDRIGVASTRCLEQRRTARGRAKWESTRWLLRGIGEGKRGFAVAPRR